jgi:hypothetical protein
MDRRNPILLALLLFSLVASAPALAQSNSSSPSSTARPEQSAQTSSQTAEAPAEAAPKKVWTNDDMPDASHGLAPAKPSAADVKASASKASIAPKPKNAKPYQDQIAKLQAQLPPLEDQISQLQAVLSGETVNETRKYAGVRLDDWSVQLKQLQQKRDDIFAKVAALQDEARHKGIPANSLP